MSCTCVTAPSVLVATVSAAGRVQRDGEEANAATRRDQTTIVAQGNHTEQMLANNVCYPKLKSVLRSSKHCMFAIFNTLVCTWYFLNVF